MTIPAEIIPVLDHGLIHENISYGVTTRITKLTMWKEAASVQNVQICLVYNI